MLPVSIVLRSFFRMPLPVCKNLFRANVYRPFKQFCVMFFVDVSDFHLLGHGLPAGLAEVEMIERARAKRAW